MVAKSFFSSLVAVIVFMMIGLSAHAITRTETVELTVPDTVLDISGFASPNATVEVREFGSVIGSVVADVNGNYSLSLVSQSPGFRTLIISQNDVDGQASNQVPQIVSVAVQDTTSLVVNIAPTIDRKTDLEVLQGSLVQINGYTAANSVVTLTFTSGQQITTTSNASGFYEFLVSTSDLPTGENSVFVESSVGAQSSQASSVVSFVVVRESDASPDLVVSPELLPPPVVTSPDNDAEIPGNSVPVSGTAIPNSQINIYENGVLIGSTFADDSGEWTFVYTAISTPVSLSFEACVGGECSVLSTNLQLNFSLVLENLLACEIGFALSEYRFWGVPVGDEISLNAVDIRGEGIFVIDWGNGVQETFNYRDGQDSVFRWEYDAPGNYSGTVRYVQGFDDIDNECQITRYFSVNVVDQRSSDLFLWILIIATLLSWVMTGVKKQQNDENNEKSMVE